MLPDAQVPGTPLIRRVEAEVSELWTFNPVAAMAILSCDKHEEWKGLLHKGYEDGRVSMGLMSVVRAENCVGAALVLSCKMMYILRICMRILIDRDRV